MYDLVVVGAGASGMMAAGRAAELGARVLLLDKNRHPGRKLLITGKGRCNITNNASLDEYIKQIYPDGRFLRHAFGHFFHHDMVLLLGRFGVKCVLERGGRYFPASNASKDVLQALLDWLKQGHVEVRHGQQVSDLLIEDGICKGIRVAGHGLPADILSPAVILATGGKSYPATGSTGDGHRMAHAAGHSIIALRPSLVPLETAGELAGRMQGLSLKNVRATALLDGKKAGQEFGEMLFTHFGLSGPIILGLSRPVVDGLAGGKHAEIIVDLKPALDEARLDSRLLRDINGHGKKKMINLMKAWLPSAMIPVFLSENNIDPYKEAHQLTSGERRSLAKMMKGMRFAISGHRSFREAVITAGGVSTREVDPKSMQSKLISKLYLTGELLDLDANTGGYNLQIAWSTGYLAGEHAALSLQ